MAGAGHIYWADGAIMKHNFGCNHELVQRKVQWPQPTRGNTPGQPINNVYVLQREAGHGHPQLKQNTYPAQQWRLNGGLQGGKQWRRKTRCIVFV